MSKNKKKRKQPSHQESTIKQTEEKLQETQEKLYQEALEKLKKAEEGEEILGVIMAGHDGRRGYIYHTSVREDARQQGIGSVLVEAALEALSQEGISKAALVAFEKNGGGNAFWERMGFTVRTDLTYRNKALREMIRKDT